MGSHRCVDFNVLRSSATCLHQVWPEMGAVQDKSPPKVLQPRQRLCIPLLSTHVALKMELKLWTLGDRWVPNCCWYEGDLSS